jgi:hypothetical protein
MKYIYLLLTSILAFACSAGNSNYPSDFTAAYATQSPLMVYELAISINGNELSLAYKNGQNNKSGNGVYTVKDPEVTEIYKYFKSINIVSMKTPEGEKMLDAPQETLKAAYDDKVNAIYFGGLKNPPDNLVKAKNMLIDLASKYNKSFKKDLGME